MLEVLENHGYVRNKVHSFKLHGYPLGDNNNNEKSTTVKDNFFLFTQFLWISGDGNFGTIYVIDAEGRKV